MRGMAGSVSGMRFLSERCERRHGHGLAFNGGFWSEPGVRNEIVFRLARRAAQTARLTNFQLKNIGGPFWSARLASQKTVSFFTPGPAQKKVKRMQSGNGTIVVLRKCLFNESVSPYSFASACTSDGSCT